MNAKCTNNNGSYNCSCNKGYFGDGFDCIDANECISNTDDCDDNATCDNTDGSFTCSCNKGFEGNGQYCSDVNECLSENSCSPDAS